MTSSKSSRKRPAKVSSDNAVISFDLLSNLTYMAAVATGGPDRDTILEWAIGGKISRLAPFSGGSTCSQSGWGSSTPGPFAWFRPKQAPNR